MGSSGVVKGAGSGYPNYEISLLKAGDEFRGGVRSRCST